MRDVNGREHRPKGLPRHEAGTYAPSTPVGDDDLAEPSYNPRFDGPDEESLLRRAHVKDGTRVIAYDRSRPDLDPLIAVLTADGRVETVRIPAVRDEEHLRGLRILHEADDTWPLDETCDDPWGDTGSTSPLDDIQKASDEKIERIRQADREKKDRLVNETKAKADTLPIWDGPPIDTDAMMRNLSPDYEEDELRPLRVSMKDGHAKLRCGTPDGKPIDFTIPTPDGLTDGDTLLYDGHDWHTQNHRRRKNGKGTGPVEPHTGSDTAGGTPTIPTPDGNEPAPLPERERRSREQEHELRERLRMLGMIANAGRDMTRPQPTPPPPPTPRHSLLNDLIDLLTRLLQGR